MPLTMHTVTFDANDPGALARFWAVVFEAGEPEVPNPHVARLHPPQGPDLLFIHVDESKAAKNRCHMDLSAPNEAAVDTEAERLVAAGASMVGRHREHGVSWATLRDPEGNEFCVGALVEDAAQ